MPGDPLAYFLTWHTYGTWLHGRQEGSVDRDHNVFGTALKPRNDWLLAREGRLLQDEPLILDDFQRGVVDDTIRDVCEYKAWKLLALNVRSTHVHAIITASLPPERLLNTLKSWATRRMVERNAVKAGRKVWTRHGSTIYLWTPEQVADKCEYVLAEQGPDLPMRYE